MFLFIDSFVLLLVLGLARSGWRRGFAHQVIDLVGFVVAVIAALRLYPVLAAPYRAFGLDAGPAALAGGLTVFVPLIVAVALIGRKAGRIVAQPGIRMTNKLLGLGAGVATAAVGLTVILSAARALPVPEALTDAVRRSPTAGVLLDAATPLTRALEAVAPERVRRLLPQAARLRYLSG